MRRFEAHARPAPAFIGEDPRHHEEARLSTDIDQQQSQPATRLSQLALPYSACRVLAACASVSNLCPELPLRDPLAERVFSYLRGRLEQFSSRELRCAAFRTHVVDKLANDYFQRTPGGLGVGVWSLLGTRAHRLDHSRWVDVDPPAVAKLRNHLLPERPRWLQLGACLCNPAWVDAVHGKSGRKLLFVLDESVLPLSGSTMTLLLDGLSRRARPGSEVLLAFDAHTRLRPSLPLRRGAALELVLRDAGGQESIARYPRLRFVDEDLYPEELGTDVAGVNAVASLHHGIGAPALAHLKLV
jgi:O-methyltransferase involved in polyketide biosynthesis